MNIEERGRGEGQEARAASRDGTSPDAGALNRLALAAVVSAEVVWPDTVLNLAEVRKASLACWAHRIRTGEVLILNPIHF